MKKILFLLFYSFNLAFATPPLTPNFNNIPAGIKRVEAFETFMVPKIYEVDQRICKLHLKITMIQKQIEQKKPLTEKQKQFILTTAKYYDLQFGSISQANILTLLSHVNIAPTSMVLAQAAIESGWGTSRFAKIGNNYFGEHCFEKGCGIAAKKDSQVEVSKFKNVTDSIQSYYFMLNTRPIFSEFRQVRQKMIKAQNNNLTQILETLNNYSGIGTKYPQILKSIIKHHNFMKYDEQYDFCEFTKINNIATKKITVKN